MLEEAVPFLNDRTDVDERSSRGNIKDVGEYARTIYWHAEFCQPEPLGEYKRQERFLPQGANNELGSV